MSHAQENRQGLDVQSSCPVPHHAAGTQKTTREVEPVDLPLERDAAGVWHIRGFEEARYILRQAETTQAGFGADQITGIQGTTNKPILYQEGKVHQLQRKQTARFFTPKAVSENYRAFIENKVEQLINELKAKQKGDMSELGLSLAVSVVGRVVGLTHSRLPGMAQRLDAFFKQPQERKTRFPLLDKALRKFHALLQQQLTLAFFFLDVQPAIKAHKRQAQDDVISHLLAQKYNAIEILTECITYAAAGMVTTREFISVAVWHLLEQPELKARYLKAEEAERFEILHEILRLEPVVGYLYRHAASPITLESQGKSITIPEGALLNLHLYATNADTKVVGDEALQVKPCRPLQGERVPSMLMAFGDGHHRCPGSFLAIQESDLFLQRLLALESLRIERAPTVTWNPISAGYELRNFQLVLDKK